MHTHEHTHAHTHKHPHSLNTDSLQTHTFHTRTCTHTFTRRCTHTNTHTHTTVLVGIKNHNLTCKKQKHCASSYSHEVLVLLKCSSASTVLIHKSMSTLTMLYYSPPHSLILPLKHLVTSNTHTHTHTHTQTHREICSPI